MLLQQSYSQLWIITQSTNNVDYKEHNELKNTNKKALYPYHFQFLLPSYPLSTLISFFPDWPMVCLDCQEDCKCRIELVPLRLAAHVLHCSWPRHCIAKREMCQWQRIRFNTQWLTCTLMRSLGSRTESESSYSLQVNTWYILFHIIILPCHSHLLHRIAHNQ